MTDKPESETTAGLSVGEVLPVVSRTWIEVWDNPLLSLEDRLAICDGAVEFNRRVGDHQRKLKEEAQATIAVQAAEIERLKEVMRERALQALSDDGQWMEHTGRLQAEIESLKAKQGADIDEVMRLADNYAIDMSRAVGISGTQKFMAAREALRSALATQHSKD